ncbi:MAG: hypothetical protein RLZZ342_370 [Candidatus Parcubacteria bacterium]|jgi:tRNA-specific 2-thiouridylase
MVRVFVGLSGGVDSAVSAALLKEQGHDVVGAFIKIWNPDFLECSWKEDRLDAMRVCVHLGIPFTEIDLSQEYMREVVGNMIDAYRAGITPNPDVLCNRTIKFGAFKKWALAEGADMVATGHYARIGVKEAGENKYALLRAIDTTKDQSYFLYRLSQDDLRIAQFPIGHLHKKEVRALADKLQLPVSKKPDSQGLCFAGDISIPEFLARYITLEKGAVLDTHGTIIGEHDGAALYTRGQRHGFRTHNNTPHYVVSADIHTNTLTVSPDKSDTLSHSATLSDVHWIGDAAREGELLDVQSRYHAPVARATLSREGSIWRAHIAVPELLSPGQSLVLYRGDECVGGGIVDNTRRE